MQPEQLTLIHRYVDIITNYIEYIADNVTTEEIIPYGCCAFFKVFEEAKRELHTYCDKLTGPDTVDYVLGLIKTMTSDMIELGCGKYSSVVNCNLHLPAAMKIYVELVTPMEKVPRRTYSPVVPSVRILKRLDVSI